MNLVEIEGKGFPKLCARSEQACKAVTKIAVKGICDVFSPFLDFLLCLCPNILTLVWWGLSQMKL